MTSTPSSRHRSTTERTSFSVANEEASLPNTITPAEIRNEFRRRRRSRKKPKQNVLSLPSTTMRDAPQKVSVVLRSRKRASIRKADISSPFSNLDSFPMEGFQHRGKNRSPISSSQRASDCL